MDPKDGVLQQETAPLILLVEDDVSLSKMYATKFTKEGFRVIVANDGADGLAKAASAHPNLILLDMRLPKYSGIEFLEQLQQHSPQTFNIPILALTNQAEKQDAERALKLGVKEYLIKAMYTPEEVLQKVRTHLGLTNNPATQA